MHPMLVTLPVAVLLALPAVGYAPAADLDVALTPGVGRRVVTDTGDGAHESQETDGSSSHTEPVEPQEGMAEHQGMTDEDMAEHEDMTDEDMAEHGGTAEHEDMTDEDMAEHGGTAEHEDMSDEDMAEHEGSTDHAEGTADPSEGSAEHKEGGESHGETASTSPRPRAAVLGSFAGVNAAVLIGAAWLRRRDGDKPRHRPRAAGAPAATPTA